MNKFKCPHGCECVHERCHLAARILSLADQALELVRLMAKTDDRNDPSMWCGSARQLFARNGVEP